MADFHCGTCAEEYELKSQKGRFGPKVVDGAYATMCKRLSADNNPNLILMNYSLAARQVTNLIVVPKHVFVLKTIERRKPLAETARRAGWVGCNILLKEVPDAGKIVVVRDGLLTPKDVVLEKWRATSFLGAQSVSGRGWLIEVMKCVEALRRNEFALADVYAFENRLNRLYPGNNNIRPKIRQQLQLLRDCGYLEFAARGFYRVRSIGLDGKM